VCTQPLLSPYEAHVALGVTQWRDQYPMDFYAKGAGPWGNYYQPEGEVLVCHNESCVLLLCPSCLVPCVSRWLCIVPLGAVL
jgi:hypothetical protein